MVLLVVLFCCLFSLIKPAHHDVLNPRPNVHREQRLSVYAYTLTVQVLPREYCSRTPTSILLTSLEKLARVMTGVEQEAASDNHLGAIGKLCGQAAAEVTVFEVRTRGIEVIIINCALSWQGYEQKALQQQ